MGPKFYWDKLDYDISIFQSVLLSSFKLQRIRTLCIISETKWGTFIKCQWLQGKVSNIHFRIIAIRLPKTDLQTKKNSLWTLYMPIYLTFYLTHDIVKEFIFRQTETFYKAIAIITSRKHGGSLAVKYFNMYIIFK